ncbi:hypothetical protein CYLTODRAFT_402037 [Cylindrobasidium torrendii FP15055 ss-10]|uniref:Tc1-like transposase DDE domain-containing protein n=1 Tax=Cylindrobasidium torrendii FP15055 ss-10 TaxID=1314674 RepID=A0A0D7B2B3_9AGAR|nr:hypothetical protein CYLTODRAFT_402037 [Cylindrobasidium torrendii FP15055 ss-10]
MHRLVRLFTTSGSPFYGQWTKAAEEVARAEGRGITSWSRRLKTWVTDYLEDPTLLPYDNWGLHSRTHPPVANEEFRDGLCSYITALEDYFTAAQVMEWTNREETKQHFGYTKSISESTANRWLQELGYVFGKGNQATYCDRHEDADVVEYRQTLYLPRLMQRLKSARQYDNDGCLENADNIPSDPITLWFHDESTFDQNDQRDLGWRPFDAPAKLQPKTKGESVMATDFVSAEYGWLRSRNGSDRARVIFCAGKGRQGYFTNEHICEQFRHAVAIAKEHYPHDRHIFMYDNARTHTARPRDAPSATTMTKKIGGKVGKTRTKVVNGVPIYASTDGNAKPVKERVRMADGWWMDGEIRMVQSFYREDGLFKGTPQVLKERKMDWAARLRFKCDKFQCPSRPPGQKPRCCQSRVLYEEPDFSDPRTALQVIAEELGVEVDYLPPFHCELTFIESCWNYSKRVYRMAERPSNEQQMKALIEHSMDAIPIEVMRRFSRRCLKFADAYLSGLNGKWAAWAAKKYHGHRECPPSLWEDKAEEEQKELERRNSRQMRG